MMNHIAFFLHRNKTDNKINFKKFQVQNVSKKITLKLMEI